MCIRDSIRDAAKGVAEDVKAEALKPGEGVGTKAGWTPRIVRTKKGTRVRMAVSYTHLDVYKRQHLPLT